MADEKLDKLIKQRDQLNARIQKEKSKESERKRKLDTQAKILLGSALLNRINSNDSKADELFRWCREALAEKDRVRLDSALEKESESEKPAIEPA